jgi:putative alpha-1,2-mannosidase
VNGGGSAQWWFAPNERRFFGIRCTRQPSPWINDYGNFLINAYVPGKYNQHKNEAKYPSGYLPSKSTFKPYLFETELIAYKSLAGDATMSVSAARHSAMIAARFPAPDKLVGEYTDASRRISVALEGESNDAAEVVLADSEFKTVVIKGWSTHNTGGIADPGSFKNHFVAAIFTGERGDEPVEALTSSVGASTEWAWADFDQDRFSDFTVRVGVSFISEEQARLNLRLELYVLCYVLPFFPSFFV